MKLWKLLILALIVSCVPIEEEENDVSIAGTWHVCYFDSAGVVTEDASWESSMFTTHQTLHFYQDNSGEWNTKVECGILTTYPQYSSYPFVWEFKDSALYMDDPLECWLSEIHTKVTIIGDTMILHEKDYMIFVKLN